VEESYDRYKEEMADVAESIELATLDKEMAEEKVSLSSAHLPTLSGSGTHIMMMSLSFSIVTVWYCVTFYR